MRHLIWQPRVMKQRIEGSQNKSQLNKRAANYFQLLRVMKQPLIALITRDGEGGGRGEREEEEEEEGVDHYGSFSVISIITLKSHR